MEYQKQIKGKFVYAPLGIYAHLGNKENRGLSL